MIHVNCSRKEQDTGCASSELLQYVTCSGMLDYDDLCSFRAHVHLPLVEGCDLANQNSNYDDTSSGIHGARWNRSCYLLTSLGGQQEKWLS